MNLKLLQLGDSALPIGGYSHSWGLEAAIDRGNVRDAPSLERWIRLWLHHALGPCEGVVVGAVASDPTLFGHANDLLEASLTPTTLRHASREMGGQLLALAEGWEWAGPSPARRASGERPWHHAPVFATLAAAAGATPAEARLVYLHQATLGMVSAGVRAIPIGHTHGQQVLCRLHANMRTLADELGRRDLETAGSYCPAYEVLCHAQAHLYTRLFRS